MQGLTQDVTLRPRTGRVLAAGVMAIAVVAFISLLALGDLGLFGRAAAPLGLLGFGGWVLFWYPAVRVGPAQVAFLNPLRTVVIDWPAVQDVQTRWSLTVVTARGTWTAWAAPRPTRLARAVGNRRNMFGFAVYEDPRERRETPRATTDVAALLVDQQWSEYRERGLLGAVEGDGVTVQWHTATILLLLGLVAAWLVALALH